MVLGTFRDKRGTLDSTRNGRAGEGDGGDDEDKLVGWLYVGSHNFTPSAWGTLSGSAFNPVLNVTNYELGVVLPLRTKEEADRFACYERPLKKYASGASPWVSPHLEQWCSATYTLDRCRRIVYITSFQTINSTPAIGLYRLSYFQHNDPYCMHTI